MSREVTFLRASVDEIAGAFTRVVESDNPTEDGNGWGFPLWVHREQVRARREDIPGLLLPQNRVTRVLVVPMVLPEWNAVFHSSSDRHNSRWTLRLSFAFFTYGLSGEVMQSLWRRAQEEGRDPEVAHVRVVAWPRYESEEPDRRRYTTSGACGLEVSALHRTHEDERELASVSDFTSYIFGHDRGEVTRARSELVGALLGDPELPELQSGHETKDDPVADRRRREELWRRFSFRDVNRILAPLGIRPFDDGFYGTDGTLLTVWTEGQEPFDVGERVPFEHYQAFRGLGPEIIRAPGAADMT
ncbi:hypothetical protein [Corynebacterium bovis]|uniref:Uncharacterized protein n=1 Tax=Corynebacterium bovis DSM 20582 = CIP 54.80 TaxID=927655 RepID=A0A8H9YA33_9CORY|nr:hypothetical protein [Corynebacterium bovis]MBB3116800.1 hypothetical protein [Corynebacterium bovis DSM 20582 = CIP 54.80]QQC46747.1 hypothetical protein I6I09_06340 [Corynebacterium bovis]